MRVIFYLSLFFFAFADIQGQGTKQDIQILIEQLHSNDDDLRMKAVKSLVDMKKEALPALYDLIETLNDREIFVKVYAAMALGNIRDEIATKPLIQAFKKDIAIKPLTQAFKRDVGILNDEIGGSLVKIGKAAIPELILAIESETQNGKKYIARTLGELSRSDFIYVKYGEDHYGVDGLLKSLNNHQAEIRPIVIQSIRSISFDVVWALHLLLDDLEPEVRKEAMSALRKVLYIGGCSTIRMGYISHLIEALNDYHPLVREFASYALGIIDIKDSSWFPSVTKLQKDPNINVRKNCIRTLSNFGRDCPEAIFAIRTFLDNENRDVVMYARKILDRMGMD